MTSEEKKAKIISGTVTLAVLLIAFVFMAFCGLKYEYPPPAAKKVILVEMMIESGGGGGGGNMNNNSRQPARSSAENLLTQPDVNLPSIPTSVKRTETTSDNSADIVDPRPNPNAVYRPGMGGGSGGGSGTGSGTGFGSGLGAGEGSGSGGKIGYGTGNRSYTYMPDLTVNEVGKVYVEVHVAATGTVLDARVINNRQYPTTITNSRIQAECVRKAKTARYKPGKEELRVIVFSL